MKRHIITRSILVLSLVSLFTDIASEMLYPVMPIYLKQIGFSIVLIGILEGLAEATAGLSKGYFGKLSDASGKRIIFVRLGYLLSSISKPMMAAFIYPLWIFFARTLDRTGKGLRTGARDAILSGETTNENKGRVFGFHRAFDTIGATLGPAIALVFLFYFPGKYKIFFLLAFIPGLFSVFLTYLLKENKKPKNSEAGRVTFFSFLKYWKQSPEEYRKLTTGLLVFALFNGSDIFLLLKVQKAGFNDITVIGVYIFYNLVYALSSFPVGIIADKIGLKKMLLTGLFLFAVVYAGFALTQSIVVFFILYFIYGFYSSATEGIAKAWITNISGKNDVATAIGTFTAFGSILTLLASTLTGVLWVTFGAAVCFFASSFATILVITFMLIWVKAGKSDLQKFQD